MSGPCTENEFQENYGRSLATFKALKRPGDWALKHKFYDLLVHASRHQGVVFGTKITMSKTQSQKLFKFAIRTNNACLLKLVAVIAFPDHPCLRVDIASGLSYVCSASRPQHMHLAIVLLQWVATYPPYRRLVYVRHLFFELLSHGELGATRRLYLKFGHMLRSSQYVSRLSEKLLRTFKSVAHSRRGCTLVRIFYFLRTVCHNFPNVNTMAVAARHGRLGVMMTLARWGVQFNRQTIKNAAMAGHLHVLKSMDTKNIEPHVYHCILGAVRGNHMAILKWLYDTPMMAAACDWIPGHAITVALKKRNEPMVHYFLDMHPVLWSTHLFDAAKYGCVSVTKRIINHFKLGENRCVLQHALVFTHTSCKALIESKLQQLGPLCMRDTQLSKGVVKLMKSAGETHTCAICYETINLDATAKGEKLFVTPCFHKWHSACLAKVSNNKCPMCRTEFTAVRI